MCNNHPISFNTLMPFSKIHTKKHALFCSSTIKVTEKCRTTGKHHQRTSNMLLFVKTALVGRISACLNVTVARAVVFGWYFQECHESNGAIATLSSHIDTPGPGSQSDPTQLACIRALAALSTDFEIRVKTLQRPPPRAPWRWFDPSFTQSFT
jgi:hypothetical protein